MPRYIVENTATEQVSEHRTWQAAMNAAAKHPAGDVRIIERDADGEREYNQAGQVMGRDGHYPRVTVGYAPDGSLAFGGEAEQRTRERNA